MSTVKPRTGQRYETAGSCRVSALVTAVDETTGRVTFWQGYLGTYSRDQFSRAVASNSLKLISSPKGN